MTIYTTVIVIALAVLVISFGVGVYHKRNFIYYRRAVELVLSGLALVVSLSYFGGIAFVQNTNFTTSGKEIVQLNAIGTTQYEGEDKDTEQYTRLSQAETDDSSAYLFNSTDYGRVVTGVKDTNIHYSTQSEMIAVRYTRVTSNPVTRFFAVANEPVAVKYTVFIPKDSVDLDSKPEAKAYPDLLGQIMIRNQAIEDEELIREPNNESEVEESE